VADGWLALRAAARAEFAQFNRSRALVGLVFVEAITFLVLVSLFGLTGSRAPTALVDLDRGPLARSFVTHLEAAHHSFALRPMAMKDAQRELSKGEIVAIIKIPRGFSTDVSHGKTVLLPVTVDNVNADLTDDIREALPSTITAFGRTHGFPGVRLVAAEHDLIDHDTGYIPYLIVSALALTAFVVAGILGAVTVTREFEADTVTQWRLAPVHPGFLLAGKLFAASVVSTLAIGAAVLVVIFGYGVPPVHPFAAFGALAICVGIFTCLGACAGALIRRTLPVAALFFGLALPLYIDSGAIEPLRFDGDKVWTIGHTSPVYQAIGIIEWGFHGFNVTPESIPQNLLVLVAWALVAVLVAAAVLQNQVARR
jgi:ABC-2 type transport system permease protein